MISAITRGSQVIGRKSLQIASAVILVAVSLLLGLSSLTHQAEAQTGGLLYVALGGDCGGMSPCYPHPQEAVDAAGPGDLIKMAAGTYTSVSVREGVTQVLFINKTVTIRGGYTTTDWSHSDPQANPTVLHAQAEGRVLYIEGSISPIIEGLDVTGGDASGLGGGPAASDAGGGVYVKTAQVTIRENRMYSNTSECGGALYLDQSDSTVSLNTIISNTAGCGGGVYLDSSAAALSGNTVEGNTASFAFWGPGGSGGGLYLRYSPNAWLSGNVIQGNLATGAPLGGGGGGGLYLYMSGAVLSGNAIADNSVVGAPGTGGGGLYLYRSTASLRGNTISSNSSDYGGGLYLRRSDAALTNNLVTENEAGFDGSGLYITECSPHMLHTTIARNSGWVGSGVHVASNGTSTSTVTLTNTVLVSHAVGVYVDGDNVAILEATLWGSDSWANTADWDGAGSILTGTRNYWGHPSFVDPDAGDYHLEQDSGALDLGLDAGVKIDMDGQPRPYRLPDLGADEYWPPGALKYLYLPVVPRNHS